MPSSVPTAPIGQASPSTREGAPVNVSSALTPRAVRSASQRTRYVAAITGIDGLSAFLVACGKPGRDALGA